MKTEYSFDNETWYDAPDGKAFVPGIGEIHLRMTKETTASQPKMKCVEPEDWPAHYDKNDPTKGTNMDSVVFGTSQPKSIGDDAQFQKRLTEYDAAIYPGQKALRLVSLIALIDSRAPAAQASATIQAAPEGYAYEVFIEFGDSRFFEPHWEKRLSVFDPRADDKDNRFRNLRPVFSAATIQEPVMVADGTNWKMVMDLIADELEKKSNMNEISQFTALCIEFDRRAAPMVADPAGVALPDDEAYTQSAYRHFMNFDAFKKFRAECLAATVKAVPSEALDEAAAYRMWRECEISEDSWFMQHLADYLPAECRQRAPTTAEWDAAMARVMQDRAPLADKTDDATTKPGA